MVRTITLIILSFLAVTANCQIQWLQSTHDFGVINEDDGQVTCCFTFVNQYSEPVSITSARATCGCTVPDYPTRSIAPGDTAQVAVTYDPQLRPGRFSKKIYVTMSSDSKKTLEVKGVVVGSESTVARRYPVVCGPLRLAHGGLMLGEIDKGRVKTVYADGYNRSGEPLKIEVLYQPEFVDLVVAPETAPAGEQVSLIAYVNSNRCDSYGLVEDSVVISPVPGEVYTLPVTLTVNEDFSGLSGDDLRKAPIVNLSATSIDFGELKSLDSPVSHSFEIANLGKNKLEIRRIYTTQPGAAVKYDKSSVKSGKSIKVEVVVNPAELQTALLNTVVTVITNDPLHPVTTVRIVAIVAKSDNR